MNVCVSKCIFVLNRDVVQRLCAAVVANSHTALTSLDLSRNSIEDRGRIFLNFCLHYFTVLSFCLVLIL